MVLLLCQGVRLLRSVGWRCVVALVLDFHMFLLVELLDEGNQAQTNRLDCAKRYVLL